MKTEQHNEPNLVGFSLRMNKEFRSDCIHHILHIINTKIWKNKSCSMFAILQYTEISQTKPLNITTLYHDGTPQSSRISREILIRHPIWSHSPDIFLLTHLRKSRLHSGTDLPLPAVVMIHLLSLYQSYAVVCLRTFWNFYLNRK